MPNLINVDGPFLWLIYDTATNVKLQGFIRVKYCKPSTSTGGNTVGNKYYFTDVYPANTNGKTIHIYVKQDTSPGIDTLIAIEDLTSFTCDDLTKIEVYVIRADTNPKDPIGKTVLNKDDADHENGGGGQGI